ncbi:MAG: sulfide/dihydroorotate dehydrogenase-like FAD/NAD-binding protein [Clostridia bacterium]|nr:sulfide/dihydroorotate dehydrogenase-like FAD/NAD-binding protein [Clostridia bacterium]
MNFKRFEIIKKQVLNEQVTLLEVYAPKVAAKAEPGQFIIFRIDEKGERIPLTIADYNRQTGGVTIIFQQVGATTMKLADMNVGDCLLDFVGPLGTASELEGYKKVAVVGGGLGTAIAYPQAKKLFSLGSEVHIITGFRNKELIILEDECKKVSNRCVVATDDGSNGTKGFVTDVLKSLIEEGNNYDLVIAIGPLVMMKFVSKLTKEYGIKTIVSMNPVMIDGTGMCGGCRITVGGVTKFACVDGPDFDGHLVDFDEAIMRSKVFNKMEQQAKETHICKRLGGTV